MFVEFTYLSVPLRMHPAAIVTVRFGSSSRRSRRPFAGGDASGHFISLAHAARVELESEGRGRHLRSCKNAGPARGAGQRPFMS